MYENLCKNIIKRIYISKYIEKIHDEQLLLIYYVPTIHLSKIQWFEINFFLNILVL